MTVSLKTDLRFPESGQRGHGTQIIHPKALVYKVGSFSVDSTIIIFVVNILLSVLLVFLLIRSHGTIDKMPLGLNNCELKCEKLTGRKGKKHECRRSKQIKKATNHRHLVSVYQVSFL